MRVPDTVLELIVSERVVLGAWGQLRFSESGSLIESTAGFSVRTLGRAGLRYVEVGRSVLLNSEMLPQPAGAAVLLKDPNTTWEDGDRETLSDADWDRIVSNIKRAFDFFGYELEVHIPNDWR